MPTKKHSLPSPVNEENYSKLRRVWYNKLKAAGFEDIEPNDYDIKNPSFRYGHMDYRGKWTLNQAKIQWAAKQEYYYLANQFLYSHKFKNIRERNIWEYHSNGVGIRAIVSTLNKLPGKKTNRDTVWKTVRKLSKLMKELCLQK